jgi:hypothetical protein
MAVTYLGSRDSGTTLPPCAGALWLPSTRLGT